MSDSTGKSASLADRLAQLRDRVLNSSKTSYEVKIQTSGNGAGTVSRTPYAEKYEKGQVVSLIARADSGSKFVRWMNDAKGSHPVCNVRMDSDKLFLAEFSLGEMKLVQVETRGISPPLHPLNIKCIGSGKGYVSRTPEAESYPDGEIVSLVAHADEGSKFVRWINDAKGTDLITKVEMDSAKSVFAEFEMVEPITPQKLVNEKNGATDCRILEIENQKFIQSGGKEKSTGDKNSGNSEEKNLASSKLIGHSNHFIDHEDGTVTDIRSGLMWLRPALGQTWENGVCRGSSKKFSLVEAKNIKISFADHSDWRLPTIEELRALVYSGKRPALDEIAFPNQVSRYFWTSSISSNSSNSRYGGRPFIFNLSSGLHGYNVNDNDCEDVRLVRSCRVTNRENDFSERSISFDKSNTDLVSANETRGISPPLHPLNIKCIGSGKGYVSRTPEAESYPEGEIVSLVAHADKDSKFVWWINDAKGTDLITKVEMDSAKSVFAEFVLSASIATKKNQDTSLAIAQQKTLQTETQQNGNSLDSTPQNNEVNIQTSVDEVAVSTKCVSRNGEFYDHPDGTVTDLDTGLTWMRYALGQAWVGKSCVGYASNYSLTSDFNVDISNILLKEGWRLPTVDELKSITQASEVALSNGIELFKNSAHGHYWTKSHYLDNKAYAYLVNFPNGNINIRNRCGEAFVRLVRKAKLPLNLITVGSGLGTVIRDIDTTDYPFLSTVRLTAQAVDGSRFECWQGDVSGTGAVCTVTMDSPKNISAEFTGLIFFRLEVSMSCSGNGRITRSPEDDQYVQGRIVTLTAHNSSDSKFKGWKGDIQDTAQNISITMDSDKSVIAEFTEIELFSLNFITTGNGSGTVEYVVKSVEVINKPECERFLCNSVVELMAVPADSSKFMGWDGSEESDGVECIVTMDSDKTVTASFAKIPAFTLNCDREGSGDGAINWSLQSGKVENTSTGGQFLEGSVVTLTATPTDGSRFKCWRGDVSGALPSCKLTFNSAKSVVAVFEALEVFALTVKASGDGQGSVKCSRDADSYFDGSSVTLTAIAAPGSLFFGWHGDAAGLDETCTVSMIAAKSVTAEFQSLTIADLATTVEYESAEHTSMKNGESAIIFYLRIRNASDKQIQISLPRATYVNHLGEEVEQSVWLSGLILGGDVAKIRAGTFRKVGLVFYKSSLNGIAKGERLYLTVEQSKPAQRLSFVFRCTHAAAGAFELIQATSQTRDEPPDTKQLEQELSALRWEVAKLRTELATAKLQLALASDPAKPARDDLIDAEVEDDEDKSPVAAEADSTLKTIVTWLARQDRVTVAALRELLLPLDLLPNAVINELNELALDLTGEMALEESGDEILVNRSTLDEILATADWSWNR